MNFLDAYEWRARIAPAFIVMLPVLITFMVLQSLLQNTSTLLLQLLTNGIVLLGLVYIASSVVRYYGQNIEPDIWKSWGGPPSTRFLRWSDTTIGEDTKQKLHKTVKAICDIELKSRQAESREPDLADEKIQQAFTQVKTIVRQRDPQGVWLIYNAEYGLYRNLYGSRYIWLAFSILGALVCGYFWKTHNNDTLLLGFVLNGFASVIILIMGWYYLPKFVLRAANRYAESVWTTFLVDAPEEENK